MKIMLEKFSKETTIVFYCDAGSGYFNSSDDEFIDCFHWNDDWFYYSL